jgi:hypothetical protein
MGNMPKFPKKMTISSGLIEYPMETCGSIALLNHSRTMEDAARGCGAGRGLESRFPVVERWAAA